MKKTLLTVFTFSVLTVLAVIFFMFSFASDDRIYDSVIRFHVIANSDTEYDQKIKLAVRDAVIEKYSAALSGCPNREEALKTANELGASVAYDGMELSL